MERRPTSLSERSDRGVGLFLWMRTQKKYSQDFRVLTWEYFFMKMEMNSKNNNKYYQTADLGLAAAISIFYPVDAVDRQNPRRALFIFKRDDELDMFIENFWKQELKVEPQAYFYQLKNLKTRIYSQG